MSVPVLIVLVMFVEAFLHYFPWRLILKRDLPRLVAYVLGVLGMMGPFTAWLIEQGKYATAVTLWLTLCAGGASVAFLYVLDWVISLVWGKREAEQRERILLEQQGGKGEAA